MQGNLSQINLNDLLLLATGAKKSGVLQLTHGKETVDVYLNEGNIIHAKCPIGEGEKALLYPVTWDEGTFNLLPNGIAPAATITKESSQILDDLKAMTHEWETILEVVPSGKALFRIADLAEDNTGPITIPNVGWRVLSKLDGIRTVQEVAEILRIPFALYRQGTFQSAPVWTDPDHRRAGETCRGFGAHGAARYACPPSSSKSSVRWRRSSCATRSKL